MGFFFMLVFIAVAAIYLLIAGFSIRWLLKHDKPKAVIWLAVAFWVLLPTWDTIIALSYHRYVCATAPDIGLTVYHTIPLDPKLFDLKTGKPMIFDKYGNFDMSIVSDKYELIGETNQYIGQWPFLVNRWEDKLVDSKNGKVIARLLDYQPAGGLWWWKFLFGRMFDSPRIQVTTCLGREQYFKHLHEIKTKPFVPNTKNDSIGG